MTTNGIYPAMTLAFIGLSVAFTQKRLPAEQYELYRNPTDYYVINTQQGVLKALMNHIAADIVITDESGIFLA